MRVVPDTNILVSAIIFGGSPERIITLAREGRIHLILSPPLLDELRRVLHEKFAFRDAALHAAEGLLRQIGEIVEPGHVISTIREDPPDNRVLEAAVAGEAEFIVSGDRRLLRLESFEGIPIVTARRLLEMSARAPRRG